VSTSGLALLAVMVVMIIALIVICLLVVSRYLKLRALYDARTQDNTHLRSRMNDLALRQFEEWKNREIANTQQRALEDAISKARVELDRWRQAEIVSIRSQAIAQSGSVIAGRVGEIISPYMSEFKYNPKDIRFVGSPIDYVVFDGMEDGEVKRIIFLEVKTGKGVLSTRQRQIRNVLHSGRVEWDEFYFATPPRPATDRE
jgi:predicted Holliday junction resolvase-like endonuclease